MAERILIHPVTRIEGHAKISIYLDDFRRSAVGAVSRDRVPRLQKNLCEGRPFHEMPGLMSRICGICRGQPRAGQLQGRRRAPGCRSAARGALLAAPPGELRRQCCSLTR